jgi:LPXTG-motif cell wall-anchored protein
MVATSTALPTTGFADEVGIPGLLGMAVLLIAVIFLARRLRSA